MAQGRDGRQTMRWLIALGVLLIGTVVITFRLTAMNNAARESAALHAFPDLQSATTQAQAKAILTRWNSTNANATIGNAMRLDLVFPFFYALLIALVCLRASTRVRTRWVAVAGYVAAGIAVIGGAFDVLENLRMLKMLGNPDTASMIEGLVTLRKLKEGGITAGLVYALLAHFNAR